MTQNDITPLLAGLEDDDLVDVNTRFSTSLDENESTSQAISVLPIAFLAALGMAATAATSIFAYASLLCKDPLNCQELERDKYTESVAVAVTIANVCGLSALGPLERLSKHHRKSGLALWIICRAMSVVILAVGVSLGSITIALSGRIFEGLASDNLLHFNLNAIYVRAPKQEHVSRLIGTSFALFMIGISISPAVAGLFPNFFTSFFLALGIFAFSLLYLLVFTKRQQSSTRKGSVGGNLSLNHSPENGKMDRVWSSLTGMILSPLQLFYATPLALFSGFALLLYNVVQSYIFSLIMVHNTLDFGFSSKENGGLLSIVHAVSASYLFIVLFGIPELGRRWRMSERHPEHRIGKNQALFALISFSMQILALLGFAKADKAWEIYVVCAFLALGLATPSFIKPHFLAFFKTADASKAMGALTMMEICGGLSSPLILGFWQAMWPGVGVFYGAAGIMIFATSLFCVGAFAFKTCPVEEECNQETAS